MSHNVLLNFFALSIIYEVYIAPAQVLLKIVSFWWLLLVPEIRVIIFFLWQLLLYFNQSSGWQVLGCLPNTADIVIVVQLEIRLREASY